MSWRQLYPFESHFCDVGSHRMHFVDEGKDVENPDVLLMVHGNPTWSFYFREIIKRFREQIRCVAPDHLGMGLSDKPQDETYDLESHINHLCTLMEAQKLERIHLMVHDWGGPIGVGAAIRMPERFSSLTITNTGLFPPPYIPSRISACRVPWIGPWMIRGLNVFPKAAVKMATEQRGGLETSIAEGFVAPYDNWANRVAVNSFVQDIPSRPTQSTWKVLNHLEGELKTLRDKPTQIIWGMKDWCFRPDCLERIGQHFPDAKVIKVPAAGHYVNEDATDVVLESIASFIGINQE